MPDSHLSSPDGVRLGCDVQRLIVRARAGDREAIGEILESYRNYLRSVAKRRMADPLHKRMDPSDLVQQTLLEAHQNLDALFRADESHLRATLRQILTCNVANAIRDHLRAQKRNVTRERPLDDAAFGTTLTSPSIRLSRREMTARFLEVVESLPEEQASAIRMRYFDGLSVNDIAAALDRSRAAAAGLLKRGLGTLRSKLGAEESIWT